MSHVYVVTRPHAVVCLEEMQHRTHDTRQAAVTQANRLKAVSQATYWIQKVEKKSS